MDEGNPRGAILGSQHVGPTATDACLVMTTLGSSSEAKQIAHRLVEDRLAACVQILPAMTSVYAWQGRVEEASEWLLLIKTLSANYPALETALRAIHPYQIPEIIVLPIVGGLPDYLSWLAAATAPSLPSE